MMVSNRNLLFQGSIFRFHVCFGGCKGMNSYLNLTGLGCMILDLPPPRIPIGKWRFDRDTWWPKKWNTLPETNSKFAPENRPGPQEERIVFQASVFRCDLLVSGRVNIIHFLSISYKLISCLIRSSCDRDVFNASRENPSWCKVYGVFAGCAPKLCSVWVGTMAAPSISLLKLLYDDRMPYAISGVCALPPFHAAFWSGCWGRWGDLIPRVWRLVLFKTGAVDGRSPAITTLRLVSFVTLQGTNPYPTIGIRKSSPKLPFDGIS